MALTLSNKLNRVLKLLSGLRDKRVLGLLRSRGFTQKDLEEGWKLFRAAIDVQVERVPAREPVDPSLLDYLDQWENRWYPTIQASLERHYPDLCEKVFANLPRTSGLELLATVPVLLRRVKDLETGVLGESGKQARELLLRRGFTPLVITAATQLLEQAGTVAPEATPHETMNSEDSAAAEDAVWAWYREWSQILRVEITDGRLLRELGLARTIQRTVVQEVDDDLGAETPEEAPQSAAPKVEQAAPAASAAASKPTAAAARPGLRGGSPFTE